MKLKLVEHLICPVTGESLRLEVSKREGDEIIEGSLITPSGTSYPIRNGIPRFVSAEEYTSTFGFQWNKHAHIYTNEKDKRREFSTGDQIRQKLNISPEEIKGRRVLDIGCGVGAYSTAIAEWGAKEVFSVDLSTAVEAAFANTRHLANVHVVQANLMSLPFRRASFDTIFSIGVLHHTPDTKKAFKSLVPYLAKDGVISIWVYSDVPNIGQRLSDRLRTMTTRMNPRFLYWLCWITVPSYFVAKIPILGKVIFHFLPPLSQEPYWEDRVLDTFDWYSPTFQWKHTYPEVYRWFQEANLSDIRLQEIPISVSGKNQSNPPGNQDSR